MKGNHSKYKLVVNHVVEGITKGLYRKGDWLPSVNEFRNQYNLSRSTVFTGLNELRSRGIINSEPGVGFYIFSEKIAFDHNIFLLFNEFNFFKEDLYNSFMEALGGKANVDLFFHNFNRYTFDTLLSEVSGKYTTYIIMSGKFEGVAQQLDHLGGRIFLLDHYHPELKGLYSSVGQNFEKDTYEALLSGLSKLRKYTHIIMVQKDPKEPQERYNGLINFADKCNFKHSYIDTVKGRPIHRGEVFMVVDDRDLVYLIKQAEERNLKLGNDFGIISYNDTLLKEVLAGGITTLSTDFTKMGRTMATLLNMNEICTVENPWRLNLRKSI